MKAPKKTIEFKFEREIHASPEEAFAGWLDSKTPGTTWHFADKFMLDPKVDGLFYWCTKDACHHYGRFTKFEPGARIEHTWVSPNTLGEESKVVVTFEAHKNGTRMTLRHSDLPDTEEGRGHEEGWNYFLGAFSEQFGTSSGSKK
jgi:uncharacterized protein YndB with AHSA1/START domain